PSRQDAVVIPADPRPGDGDAGAAGGVAAGNGLRGLPRRYQPTPVAAATSNTSAAASRLRGLPAPGFGGAASRPIVQAIGSKITLKVPTGSGMFLTLSSPRFSNSTLNLPRTASRTPVEMQMPPGSASVSNLAATFTVSP